MRRRHSLRVWDSAVTSYLQNRRAFGRRYSGEEWILNTLRDHLVATPANDLDQRVFDRWREGFRHLNRNTRRAREIAVYNFCRFRRRSDSRCFLPNPLSFARKRPYRMPVILEPQQIAQLLAAASALPVHRLSPLQPFVVRIAIILLYTAGLRRGEVARLRLEDVDLRTRVLRIRESKFHKSRWVPLAPSACTELRRYVEHRRKSPHGNCPTAPLLFNGKHVSSCYSGAGLGHAIRRLFYAQNIRDDNGRRPRVHDLRHSFAAAALLRWYASGADVQANLPKLALYMGHVSIVSTANYLRCTPALMARASERFERSFANVVAAGAS